MVVEDQFRKKTVVQGKILLQMSLQASEIVAEDQSYKKIVVQVKFHFKWTYKYQKKSQKISFVKKTVQGKIPLQMELQAPEKVGEGQFCKKTVVQGKIPLEMDLKYQKKLRKISSAKRLWFREINDKCNHSESELESESSATSINSDIFIFFILYLHAHDRINTYTGNTSMMHNFFWYFITPKVCF